MKENISGTETSNHFFDSFKQKKCKGLGVSFLRRRKFGGKCVLEAISKAMSFKNDYVPEVEFISVFIPNPNNGF